MFLQAVQRTDQRQSLVVNAQMQQAICLLQMSNLDLQGFIEKEALENPFLHFNKPEQKKKNDRLDSFEVMSRNRSSGAEFDYIAHMARAPKPSLYTHVSEQFDLMFENARDRLIADCFLEALEPSGWLGESIESIAERCGLSHAFAAKILDKIQMIEPAGLFARSLVECLELQAKEQGVCSDRFKLLLENIDKLAKADMKSLAKACKCSLDELREELRILRGLNPKPGADYDSSDILQKVPDVLVSKGDKGWQVDLNRSTLPSVHINHDKVSDTKVETEETQGYISERLSMARWLRRAVEHRNSTTLKVGAEIVRQQGAFLENGPSCIRPMILRDVAEAVGVHESTVSRVTNGTMIQTPQGTFPMKSFFSASLSRAGEEDASAAAIRYRVQQLVKEEDSLAPLSDDAIAALITKEGTKLARRTVAKYREMLNIPSSFQRRRSALLAG